MANIKHPCNHCALCEVALFPPLLFLAICRQWLTPHFFKSFLPRSVGGLHNSCCLLTNTKAQAIYYCPVAPQYEPSNINESFNLGHIFQPIIQSSGFSSADQQKDDNILTMRFFIKFVSWGDSSNIYQPSEWTRIQNCSP